MSATNPPTPNPHGAIQTTIVTMLSRYISFSFSALLIWDMLLTLKDEVQLIWPARWTIIKGMFLINRYGVPVMMAFGFATGSGYLDNLTDSFCRSWLLINLGSEQLSLLLVSFVMVFRLHAAWGTSRKMLLILITLWLAAVTTTIFAWVHVLYNQRARIKLIKSLKVCFPAVDELWRLFVPNACLHFVLLIILIIKAIATPRSKNTAMLIILLRDGIVFYSITFCVLLAAVVTWASLGRAFNAVPIYTTWTITTLSTSHFLLSLKYSQTVQQTWIKRTDVSALGGPTNDRHRPTFEPIEMEPRRDSKGRTLLGESSPPFDSGPKVLILRTQYNFPNHRGTYSPQAPIDSGATLVGSPPATLRGRPPPAFAVVTQQHGSCSWWWWLLGRDVVTENQMVEVDARHAEWWDKWEDRGPGWQESKVGRYDGWL